MQAQYKITIEYSGTKTFTIDADRLEVYSMNCVFDHPDIIEKLTNPDSDDVDSHIIEMRYIREQ